MSKNTYKLLPYSFKALKGGDIIAPNKPLANLISNPGEFGLNKSFEFWMATRKSIHPSLNVMVCWLYNISKGKIDKAFEYYLDSSTHFLYGGRTILRKNNDEFGLNFV